MCPSGAQQVATNGTLLKANLLATSMAYKHARAGIAKKGRPDQMDAHAHGRASSVNGLKSGACVVPRYLRCGVSFVELCISLRARVSPFDGSGYTHGCVVPS